MSELAGALLLILGGIVYGFGLARWKPLVLTAGFLVLAGVAAALLAPRVTESAICRLGGGFLSHDTHPGQLVGAWAGWDTEVRRNWFGPLWLAPEDKAESARREIAAASETR